MKAYARLTIALLVSLLVMFLLSFTQTRTWSHFLLNLSNLYISLTMIGAMGLIMLAVMWPMFDRKKVNLGLVAGFAILLVGAFGLARTETFVDNEAFLRSMIPHHSRAILVCEEAHITDPEIVDLCAGIVRTQQDEIAQMQEILKRY